MNVALKRLKYEDLIWITYIFIAIFAIYANKLDRDYLFKHDINAYKKEKIINIIIFSIALIIYIYFFSINTKDLRNCNKDKINDQYIREIASLLFLIGGIIYLLLEIKSVNSNEIAFI